jgi:hypothetical protein
MHKQQIDFVKRCLAEYDKPIRSVTEFGSLNVNGTVRDLFDADSYVGIDIGPGPGVDVVCRAHTYQGPQTDCVISCEMLEHDEYWQQSLRAMCDHLSPGGLLIMTCATTGRAEHGTRKRRPGSAPFVGNYYRNLTQSDVEPYLVGLEQVAFSVDTGHKDLYLMAVKRAD